MYWFSVFFSRTHKITVFRHHYWSFLITIFFSKTYLQEDINARFLGCSSEFKSETSFCKRQKCVSQVVWSDDGRSVWGGICLKPQNWTQGGGEGQESGGQAVPWTWHGFEIAQLGWPLTHITVLDLSCLCVSLCTIIWLFGQAWGGQGLSGWHSWRNNGGDSTLPNPH